jgi:hypothetical protein
MPAWRWEGVAAISCFLVAVCLLMLNWPLKLGPLVWLALLVFGIGLALSGLRQGSHANRALAVVALVLNSLSAVGLLLIAFGGLRYIP